MWLVYRDGSKLRQGAEAQSLNESTGGSLAFGRFLFTLRKLETHDADRTHVLLLVCCILQIIHPVIPSICIFVCYCRHINCFKETLRD